MVTYKIHMVKVKYHLIKSMKKLNTRKRKKKLLRVVTSILNFIFDSVFVTIVFVNDKKALFSKFIICDFL